MTFLEEILEILKKEGVTAYQIAQKTSLTEAAIGKIFNGKTKNPQKSTIDILNNYILNYTDSYPRLVKEGDVTYDLHGKSSINRIVQLDNGQHWVSMPLIEADNQENYLASLKSDRFIKELPTHSIIIDQIDKGKYIAFSVNGDSMDDGTHKGIRYGAILTCREFAKDQWATIMNEGKRPYWVVVHKKGILFKQIIEVDEESITCHSLNPSPEYNDFKIPMTEILQICYAVNVSRSVGDE